METGAVKPEAEVLTDGSGAVYPVQKTDAGAIAYVKNLPAKGYKAFWTLLQGETAQEPQATAETPFVLDDLYGLETPFYRIRLDEQGMFTSIYDKDNEREVVQEEQRANLLRMYESENALTKAHLTVNTAFEKAYVCNLLEETESEAAVNGNTIEVVLKPYEVVTVLVR